MSQDPVLEGIKILTPFAAFGLGIWGSRYLESWKIKRMQPEIEIQNYVIPVVIDHEVDGNKTRFIVNRLVVINKGKSGAKDCKVYVRIEERSRYQRVGWMLPDDNSAFTVTLNVNTPEYVDLIAISEDGRHIVFTDERGLKVKPGIELVETLPGKIPAWVIVASSNAEPAERRFNIKFIPPRSDRIIVEFPLENP
jgi:hypothetical protein